MAAAKAELIRDLRPGAPWLYPPASRCSTSTCATRSMPGGWPGGEVRLLGFDNGRAEIEAREEIVQLDLGYAEPHNLLNALAVAAARSVGVPVGGSVSVRCCAARSWSCRAGLPW